MPRGRGAFRELRRHSVSPLIASSFTFASYEHTENIGPGGYANMSLVIVPPIGYKPLCIKNISTSGASSLCVSSFAIDGNTVKALVRNVTSSSFQYAKIWVRVIFASTTLFGGDS